MDGSTAEKVFSRVRDVLAGLLCTLFLICLAVVVTLNFRPLYYADIQALNIPTLSGMQEQEIRQNYDALIDYNTLLYNGELKFPTLPMSESGRFHFAEVRNIFVAVQWGTVFGLFGVAILAVCMLRRKHRGFLKWTGILSLGIPVVLGLLAMAGWNHFFVQFHKLFFNNDLWIFSPATDPVIMILPDTFFFHCALMIFGLVLFFAAMCLGIYAWLRQKEKKVEANKK